jgi:NAD-dependent SIR2 family protein deacetylase
MKIGTDTISPEQTHLLAQARSGTGQLVVEPFVRITQDDEIRTGVEEIHPDWMDLYKSKVNILRRYAPPRLMSDIESFFEKLSQFDRQLCELDLVKLRTTFLLGAGASKPAPSNIPTVKELLPQLLERGRRLDRDDVTKLAAFCEERAINNIEDLLTAAQLATFSSRNPTILRLLNYLLYGGEAEDSGDEIYYGPRQLEIYERPRRVRRREAVANVSSVAFLQDTLQVLFGLLASTMLPAEPNGAHEAIAAFTKAHPNSTIVTTNYDCCMDLALEAVQVPLTYRLDFANRVHEEDSGRARLVKLHGSLNWYYCETCQEVQCVDIRSTVENYKQDKAPYSVIAICKDCGGQKRGLLVPPLAMKFDVAPPLTPLLADARNAFEEAEAIVVVGFSFAEADVYISRMLSKSMQTKPGQKLVIIDPDADVAYRVRRKFKASIPSFDEQRIVRLTEDCSAALPKLLSGGYLLETKKEDSAAESPAVGAVQSSA